MRVCERCGGLIGVDAESVDHNGAERHKKCPPVFGASSAESQGIRGAADDQDRTENDNGDN